MASRHHRPAPGRTTPRDLATLPKAHLHLHLVGSMRPATLADLARRNGERLPPALSALTCRVGSLPTAYHGLPAADHGADVRGFARFDGFYVDAKRQLRSLDDLARLVHELAADESAAGSRWVEVTANPGLYHGRFGPEEAVLEALLDAGRQATEATGVGIGWVVSADRRHPDHAVALADLAVRYRGWGVVGFGLANDEAANPSHAFGPAFDVARDGGLLAVPHAGELTGADDVAGAVRRLGADRIGHGIRAVDDRALLDAIAERGTCLELCPASNVALGAIDHLSQHPLPMLWEAGCAVTLASDDPLLFGSDLVDQYVIARSVFGFSDEALAELARHGIRAAGCPPSLRADMLADVDRWLGADVDAVGEADMAAA